MQSEARPTDFVAVDDRRREPRHSADGEIRLLQGAGFPAILGRLLDVSNSGFRAAHECPELQAGMELDFSHSGCTGRARIMWNRSAEGRWESGFFIVTRR